MTVKRSGHKKNQCTD